MDPGDYARFVDCVRGPGDPVFAVRCREAMFDEDQDVDLRDFAGFQTVFAPPCSDARANDSCICPVEIGEGSYFYNNVGANTDGPDEPLLCDFFGQSQIASDLWYCYTASCNGPVFVNLCDSSYDTRLAVYEGCECPREQPLGCSEDSCGRGVLNFQSRLVITVAAGRQYMIRAGGFLDEQGDGRLAIGCVVDSCGVAANECSAVSPEPGCADASCCADTCALDVFCCDVEWDATCVAEASGICTGQFPACAPDAGSCGLAHPSPGCEDVDCCNRVCANDLSCCFLDWDATCAKEAQSACFLACGPDAGSCFAPRSSPGCDAISCCETVCANDPFCCRTAWDEMCVEAAARLCL